MSPEIYRRSASSGGKTHAAIIWILAGTHREAVYHAGQSGLGHGEWRYLLDPPRGVRSPVVWCVGTYYERDGIGDLMADLRTRGAQGWEPKTGIYGPL